MDKRILTILLLLVVSLSRAEILVLGNDAPLDSPDSHDFIINKYYTAPSVSSPDFKVEPAATEAIINPCERANLSFVISNPTASLQTYKFEAVNFKGIAFIAPGLQLDPGQKAIVRFQLQPDCSLSGDLGPSIHISSADEEAYLPLILRVSKDYGYNIKMQEKVDTCNRVFSRATLEIENLAVFENEYSISSNKDWAQPEADIIKVPAGKAAAVNINLAPDFSTEATSLVTLEITPKYGDIKRVEFTVSSQNCFGQRFTLSDKRICEGSNANIKLTNTGTQNAEYELVVGDDSDFELDERSISLKSGEEKALALRLNPIDGPATYNLHITSFIKNTEGFEETISQKIEVVPKTECSVPVLLTRRLSLAPGDQKATLLIRNSGFIDETYGFELIGLDWITLEDDELRIQSLTDAPLELDINAEEEGDFLAALLITAEGNTFERQLQVHVSDTTLLMDIWNLRCIILLVVLLLVVLAFAIKFVFDLGDPKKALTDLLIVVLMLLLAAIIFSLCFGKIASLAGMARISTVTPEENICTTYYEEEICDSMYYISFPEGHSYELDLSRLFFDPDGDKLSISAEKSTNIKVAMARGRIRLTPVNNWHGMEEITFAAEDGRGGYAESRKFYVHVLDTEEFHLGNYLLDNYAVLGITAIVILLMAFIYLSYLILSRKDEQA